MAWQVDAKLFWRRLSDLPAPLGLYPPKNVCIGELWLVTAVVVLVGCGAGVWLNLRSGAMVGVQPATTRTSRIAVAISAPICPS